jgi:23S rRNA pseudouridine2605 synthase
MSQSPFQKFVAPKKNSVKKEEFKQAKKKAKKERAAAINARFDEKRKLKQEAWELRQKAKESEAARGIVETTKNKLPKGDGQEAKGTRPISHDLKAQEIKEQGTRSKIAPIHKKDANAVEMPLNKYLAHCGICSRRDAVEIIKKGEVKVNGKAILEPAFKVSNNDDVVYNNKKVFVTKNLVYILINKPKDYITTTDDPQGRKTVLQLTKSATTERIYPVGRLDRNTSGVLLMTNDGELTQKLSHPSYEVKKVYEATLDKPLTKVDFDKIIAGVVLEDGKIAADSLGYVDPKDKTIIGIEIHSGRNRIVRRIFEHLGYDVKGLDRVLYAGLTKKNVPRGKWRFLAEKEIRQLKYINKTKLSKDASK